MRAPVMTLAAVAVLALGLADTAAAQQQGGRGGGGRGGGRGGAIAIPDPAPRDSNGRVMMGGVPGAPHGVWTPNFGIRDPVAPYETVPFQPWSKALYDDRQPKELEPHARCKASGGSRQFLTPYGVEFVEVSELQRLYIFDIGGPHTFRTVYMDGRSHPDNWSPTNYGHSIGWWEGDTLVIDTIGFNEDFWFGRRGLPHTTRMHMLERFTRTNKDTIDYDLFVEDPNVYTGIVEGGFNLRFNETTELFEYVCQQANYAHELMVGDDSATSIDRSSNIIP